MRPRRRSKAEVRLATGDEPSVFRPGGVSYLRIPAPEPVAAARFYEEVFGWSTRGTAEQPGFTDASGHVIGHFVHNQQPVGEDGVRPYVYVERVDEVLAAIASHGGQTVTEPYPEGDLWVATFRDPAGNVVGIWQHGPRG